MIMIIPGSFKTLVNFYSVCAWLFYFLAVLALIVLRFKEPELKRPYKVWLSTPVLFCIVALFLFVMPFIEAPMESFAALGFTALAVPFWLVRVKYGEQVGLFWEGKSYSFKSEICNGAIMLMYWTFTGLVSKLNCHNRCGCLPWNRILFWKRGGENYERQHMMAEVDDV
jgi:amino acid transporter